MFLVNGVDTISANNTGKQFKFKLKFKEEQTQIFYRSNH